MKLQKSIIGSLVIAIVVAALYRIIPGRPFGFAPQIGLALFGGALIKDKKWAFALPIFSMIISDAIYQALYLNGLTSIRGFYSGQWLNYLEIASVVVVGFFMRKVSLGSFTAFSFIAPTWFFLISNFTVWAGSEGTIIPKTMSGLMATYTLGLPFYYASVASTFVFGALFFGSWYYMNNKSWEVSKA
ncbi:MAG: hypothetical protein K2P88_12680 [Chitinophagaceae bacterium]|uniref:DUF6580 family putative transport protein n=1 Tax=unclassified Paraflavitalea TaxID=2798305 RepID=UPI003D3293F2|nr:hypothetical protein [Chitinophagaceae bacterium]